MQTNLLDKSIPFLIKGLIFTLPLFFLPLTEEFFEYNKQYLLWLIVPIIFILWIISTIKPNKKIVLKRTPLDIPILTFLIIITMSAIFSVDRFSSFFGLQGWFGDAWLGILSCILFYFMVVNLVSLKGRLRVISLIETLLYSYSLILVLSFFSLFGWLDKIVSKIGFNPANFLNLIGESSEFLAIYCVAMMVLLIGIIFSENYENDSNKLRQWLYKIILFLSIALLIIINFSIAWLCLLLGGLLYIIAELLIKRTMSKRIIYIFLLTILASIFLFIFNSNYKVVDKELPTDIRLNYKSSSFVSWQTLKNNLLLGSGPGTFFYDYSLYRPSNFNNAEFWELRFNKAHSHILEMLGTIGILGFLSYLIFISSFIFLAVIFLKNNNARDHGLALTLIMALLILILAQFLYLSNTALLFLFWLFLSLLMVLLRETGIKGFINLNLTINESFSKLVVVIAILISTGLFILMGYELKFWVAEYNFFKSNESNLIKATMLNPYRYYYQVKLAKYYLNEIKDEMIKPASSRNIDEINNYISKSINAAQTAVRVQPNSVIAAETLGMIYRDISSLVKDSEPLVIQAFDRAIKLEPTNPVLVTELGKAYLKANMLNEATATFLKALELKGDYYEAKFGLAKVYARKDKINEALGLLEELSNIYEDENIYYEMGRLKYNKGETNQAIEDFKKVIEINVSHSNALYSLGLAYELLGEKEEALEYFKKVLELNPGNVEIEDKIMKYSENVVN